MRGLLLVAPVLFSCLPACGGGGGGSSQPPTLPNEAPTLVAPSGLSGTAPNYTFVLAVGGAQTLTFTANDPDGDPLQWQVGVDGGAATAAGISFTAPATGSTLALDFAAVSSPAAALLTILVEDPKGGIAAVDLQVVRSGAPGILGVTPDSAFAGKAQPVAITGSGLQLGGIATTTASFAGTTATATTIVDDTTLTCTTPIGVNAGAAVVAVTNQYGASALPSSAFTFYSYPPSLFGNDVRVDAGDATALELARDGDVVHAVWLEGTGLVHRASYDRGANWSSPTMLSGAENASQPCVIVAGDDVAVAWVGDNSSILLRRSTDGGANFATVQRLDPTGAAVPVRGPRLAQSGDRRFAAWLSGDAGSGAARVRTVASADGGATWTTQNLVHDGGANQSNVQIVAAGSDVQVLYEDATTLAFAGVFVARSTDAASTWLSPQRLSSLGASASAAQFAGLGARRYAIWLQNGALLLSTSGDRGATWSGSTIQLQGAQGGAVTTPQLAIDAGHAYAAYVVAGTAIRVASFTLVGATVRQATVESAVSNSAEPQLAVVGNYVFTAWREGDLGDGSARVLFAVSTDSAQTFPTPTGFGDGSAAQQLPQLAVDGAHLLLGWTDARAATSAIFVNRSQ